MPVTGITPYDLSKLLRGPCRVLYAPIAAAIPSKLSEVIEVEGEYKAKGEWKDFGATNGGGTYSRQFATSGYQIDQASGNVDEEVTDAVRAISANFHEISPELLQIMEEASSITTVAKAAGNVAEKQVKVGSVESLTAYRFAIIGRRLKGQGADVTQKDAVVRGAMTAFIMYRGKLTGDQTAIQLAKGQLASAPLTFQAYPESGKSVGQEHGFWLAEQTGTIE